MRIASGSAVQPPIGRYRAQMRRTIAFAATLTLLAACGSSSGAPAEGAQDLPPTDPQHIAQLLEASDRPVVLNVWASWCIPCRSEAPLLRVAHEQFGDDVRFVGVDVADNQADATAFLDEFGLTFENYFDPDRSVPASLARNGVPLTFFFDAGGELVSVHAGVVDERALALGIDELLARAAQSESAG